MRHAPGVKMTTAGGGAILLDTRAGLLFDLNATAALVWSALEGRAPEQIARIVHQRFPGQAHDVILAHVRSCLADLATRRLIVID